jgi:electron transfer flavoprotein beta subunit
VSAMRILACFKVTPDYEALRESEWAAGVARSAGTAGGSNAKGEADAPSGVDTRYVRRILNCFDESALELALRLSDALTGLGGTADLGARLCAVSIGGTEAEPHLKTLLALGFERAARVHAKAALDFAPAVTAALIAAYAGRVDRSDLLMLGARSGPGEGGTVPFRVAEQLGWSCLTQVTEVEPLAGGRLRVTLMTDDGPARLTVHTPCVLAVGNAVVSHLRVPTLTDRLAVRGEEPVVLGPADLGVDVADAFRRETSSLVALESIDRRREGLVIAGDTPRAKAQALFDSRLKSLLEGL